MECHIINFATAEVAIAPQGHRHTEARGALLVGMAGEGGSGLICTLAYERETDPL